MRLKIFFLFFWTNHFPTSFFIFVFSMTGIGLQTAGPVIGSCTYYVLRLNHCPFQELRPSKCQVNHLFKGNWHFPEAGSGSVWPDVKIISCPISPKSCPKSRHTSLTLKVTFFKIAQKVDKYLGYFWKKICHQNL